MKDKIKQLIIGGMAPADVASVLGCTPGYVSQVCSDPEFKADLEAAKILWAAEQTEDTLLEKRYENLEHKLLTHATAAMAEASFGELMRGVETLHKRKQDHFVRKNPVLPNTPNVTVHVTALTLPAHATKQMGPVVEVNDKNEIIAIGSQSMAPLSSDGVRSLFANIAAQKAADSKVMAEI